MLCQGRRLRGLGICIRLSEFYGAAFGVVGDCVYVGGDAEPDIQPGGLEEWHFAGSVDVFVVDGCGDVWDCAG